MIHAWNFGHERQVVSDHRDHIKSSFNCTCEQVSDISIFRLVLVPKELLNKLLVFAVVMNLIVYRKSESHN